MLLTGAIMDISGLGFRDWGLGFAVPAASTIAAGGQTACLVAICDELEVSVYGCFWHLNFPKDPRYLYGTM